MDLLLYVTNPWQGCQADTLRLRQLHSDGRAEANVDLVLELGGARTLEHLGRHLDGGGRLCLLIEETEHYELTEGDSLFFRSERSHRWWNDRDSPSTVLWMNVPLVQSAPVGMGPRVQAEGR